MNKKFTAGSWKTTSAGLTLIAGAFVHVYIKRATLTEEDLMLAVGGVLAGVGLLVARDNDKTSEAVGADPITKAAALNAQAAELRAKAAAIPPKP